MIDINAPLYIFIFISTFALTFFAERLLIPILRKSAEQPIYSDGPHWHKVKSGTPTMGGLAFLSATALALAFGIVYLAYRGEMYESLSLSACLAYAVLNSLVGVLDDCKKLKHNQNGGLTPKQKLLLQGLLAAAFLLFRYTLFGHSTTLSFSFGTFDIGIWYYPLVFLILVGITNCANLTDGIDGLASGVAFAAGAALFFISCAFNTEASVISAAVMGAAVAFLLFNLHPARIFMGDTGSLFLGAMLSAAAVALGNPLIILIVGGVYSIEGASVIIQVVWYKLTKKRLFRMAPLHHHLEQLGWSENRICIVAIILTLLLAIPAYILYLP